MKVPGPGVSYSNNNTSNNLCGCVVLQYQQVRVGYQLPVQYATVRVPGTYTWYCSTSVVVIDRIGGYR